MTSQSLAKCSCHAHRSDVDCPMWTFQQLYISRCNDLTAPLELDCQALERYVISEIQCGICKNDALEMMRSVSINPLLSIPIEFRGSPYEEKASMILLLKQHPEYPGRRFVARLLQDLNEIPTPVFSAPRYRDEVYRYLYNQSGGGFIVREILRERAQNGQDDLAMLVQSLNDLCAESILRDDTLLAFAHQLDLTFEAIYVGYSFLRLYHPQTMAMDLVWMLNNHRQDQADIFIQCIDYLNSSHLTVGQAWFQLRIKLQECFEKSFRILKVPQVWDALRYGIHLFSPNITNSFIYRHLQPIFPLQALSEFFLHVKDERNLGTALNSLTAKVSSIVNEFLSADQWNKLELEYKTLSGFSAGLLSSEKRRFIVSEDDLVACFAGKNGQIRKLVLKSEIAGWFGIEGIPDSSLEEGSRRFWETRVSQYRNNTHDFLRSFLISSTHRSVDTNVWNIVRLNMDALFSVKIGIHAYAELDWILARFHETKSCKIFPGDGAIHRALSHIMMHHLLCEEGVQNISYRDGILPNDVAHLPMSPSTEFHKVELVPDTVAGHRTNIVASSPDDITEARSESDDTSTSSSASFSQNKVILAATDCTTTRAVCTSPIAKAMCTSPIFLDSSHAISALGPSTTTGSKSTTVEPDVTNLTSMVEEKHDEEWEEVGAKRKLTKKTQLSQFHESWSGKTNCVIRVPAAFFSFITDDGALHDIAEKTTAFIDILRTGKVLVAASAFRIHGKTKEAVSQAVQMFKELVMNLGLCEKRLKVSKRVAAKIVGKGGERISVLRSQSSCKIFLSNIEEPESNLSWVILFGRPEHVTEAYRLIKRCISEANISIGRQNYPNSRARNLVTTTSSSSMSDDEHQPQQLIKTPPRSTLFKASSSDGSEADQDMGTPSSCEEGKFGEAELKKSGKTTDTVKTEDGLFKAVQRRDWSGAMELIAKNEGISFVAPSGTTILHKAAERNAPESLMKALIERGLDPNQAVIKKGYTAIHFAIQSNSKPSVLDILIKAGADVNRQDDQGSTPSHLAALRNASPGLVERLINAGADVSIQDKAGLTPYTVAVSVGASKELIHMLQGGEKRKS